MEKVAVTIGTKFETSYAFVSYVKKTYGLTTVTDSKLKAFFENNKNLKFSNTGILKAVKAL